jgi:hypothetical protein
MQVQPLHDTLARILGHAADRTQIVVSRWVSIATMAADGETLTSRQTGGRG